MNRDNKLKLIFIILEFVSGFGFGVLGVYIFSFFDKGNLETSIFNSFLVAFISMIVGIVLVGYFHFRNIGQLNEFGKAMVFCVVGLFLFLILYILIDLIAYKFIDDYFISVILPITMPLIGGVLGLNFVILKTKRNK